jgi:hypothetical protein
MDVPHLFIAMHASFGKLSTVYSIDAHAAWVCRRDPDLNEAWVRRHIVATIKKWSASQGDPQLAVSKTYPIAFSGRTRFIITLFESQAEQRRTAQARLASSFQPVGVPTGGIHRRGRELQTPSYGVPNWAVGNFLMPEVLSPPAMQEPTIVQGPTLMSAPALLPEEWILMTPMPPMLPGEDLSYNDADDPMLQID